MKLLHQVAEILLGYYAWLLGCCCVINEVFRVVVNTLLSGCLLAKSQKNPFPSLFDFLVPG